MAASKSEPAVQLRALKRLVRLEPKNAEWHAALACLREGLEAEADLERALELDPCHVRALEQKAMLLERKGQPLQAIELLEKVARENRGSKDGD